MSLSADTTGHAEIDGDLYPTDRIGPDGKPLPITDEQARRIADILEEEFTQNPVFREAVTRRAADMAKQRGAA